MKLVLEWIVIVAVLLLSLRRALFLAAALRRPRPLPSAAPSHSVTVVVPARNESPVVPRLLASLSALEYPTSHLRFVLVCDGCIDDTPRQFHAWAAGRADVRVLELPQRVGKAAALNAGLALVDTELVAVLDADLATRPDYLTELVRPFADERVAAAAGYLRPANADVNAVTRYAAVTSWVHQLVTSAGTDRLGLNPPTFGASAYRTSALREIGGFPPLPVGEDVATSARLTHQGWRTRFVVTAVADNTLVSNLRAFWRQHVRWTRSVLRVHSGHSASIVSTAQRLEMHASSIGYADRLVFATAALGATMGLLSVWVPFLYLALPALGVLAALFKARVGRRLPIYLLSTAFVFAADLVASVAAVLMHASGRPFRWDNLRWNSIGDGTSR
jgi:cellulose synthase/poly-beta-1,6-N-acetylglucosamine synthase-like glycosyltransferase